MIEWYKDNELGIFFNIKPDCNIRIINPEMTDCEKKEIEKYPFINNNNLEVNLFDFIEEKNYYFKVEKGYCWDGATIPRFFWRIIGAKTDPRFLIPSLIHDKLCQKHDIINNNRYFSTKVFERLLYVSGVSDFKRWMMFHSVDNYQKFCGWEK